MFGRIRTTLAAIIVVLFPLMLNGCAGTPSKEGTDAGLNHGSGGAKSIVTLLQSDNTAAIQKRLERMQRGFEAGTVNEIQLRNAFRPFYHLNGSEIQQVWHWAARSPHSYVAHLALGIVYKRLGYDARGANWISMTPKENIEVMLSYFRLARAELRRSLTLTKNPYLSVFHLLTMSMMLGQPKRSKTLLAEGNRLLPNNSLVRCQYADSLLPRWGGSYAQFSKFVARTRQQAVPASVIIKLEAIKYDDMGNTYEGHGQIAKAHHYFREALLLGLKAGGTFNKDFLLASRYYMCTRESHPDLCR